MGAKKLEPIDWREFANDAVLNGNMSTLYHRPASEDPTAYASTEALAEIDKRANRPPNLIDFGTRAAPDKPTVGTGPTVGLEVEAEPPAAKIDAAPTVGVRPTVGVEPGAISSVVDSTVLEALAPDPPDKPTVGLAPTVGAEPTVGLEDDPKKKYKPIKDVQDALTLAGHVLYKAMYGAPDGARSKTCTKGYRQLAAETHLDKDTVRDLIGDFKEKGIVRETRTYDPDIRMAKTYEILSYKAILQIWREAELLYVTTGRRRPLFCNAEGVPLTPAPTVGLGPVAPRRSEQVFDGPTVGLGAPGFAARTGESRQERQPAGEILDAIQQITGSPVDQEAAERLIADCRAEAPDCTIEEIVEFAWSKAFLCRSGKIENPVGFLIAQLPKHFQGEALQAYRQSRRKELEAAAAAAARAEERRQEAEREMAEMEEKQRVRIEIAGRHRAEQGIDLKALLEDTDADDVLKDWADRMLKQGHRFQSQF